MKMFKSAATALAVTGMLAASVPAGAAPVMSSAAGLQQAAASDVTQVRYRHRHGGWGGAAAAAGVGFAAGAILGAATAPRHYYGEPYGYQGGAYAYDPGYAYAPAPRYQQGYPGCDRVDSSGVTRFDNC
jgi:hypothetical protein